MRRMKGRGHLIIRGDWSKVSGVEIIQLPNKKVDIVRREVVVFLQVVKSNKGKSSGKIPPKDVNRETGVLRRANNMHHQGVKGEGRRNMNLY